MIHRSNKNGARYPFHCDTNFNRGRTRSFSWSTNNQHGLEFSIAHNPLKWVSGSIFNEAIAIKSLKLDKPIKQMPPRAGSNLRPFSREELGTHFPPKYRYPVSYPKRYTNRLRLTNRIRRNR